MQMRPAGNRSALVNTAPGAAAKKNPMQVPVSFKLLAVSLVTLAIGIWTCSWSSGAQLTHKDTKSLTDRQSNCPSGRERKNQGIVGSFQWENRFKFSSILMRVLNCLYLAIHLSYLSIWIHERITRRRSLISPIYSDVFLPIFIYSHLFLPICTYLFIDSDSVFPTGSYLFLSLRISSYPVLFVPIYS